VEGNDIGTDGTGNNSIPNDGAGILVNSRTNATIGGSAGAGNIIAFNQGAGVATAPGSHGTKIRFNAIFSNAGPGIDLNNNGLTSNLPGGTYNTPVLASVSEGTIMGTLSAAPNSTYVIDFYASSASDGSATSPQGRDHLTSTTVTTDLVGHAVFIVSYTPFPSLPILTATSTAADGTTSEFSPPLGFALTASGTTFAATTGVAFQGEVASFTSTDPLATAANFTATIAWGDGTANSTGTIVASPGGFVVVGTHTYTTANPVTPVTVTIQDTLNGNQAVANSLADVSGPGGVLTTYGQMANFVAGTLYGATLVSFTDSNPGAIAGQFTAVVTWGDGTSGAGTISISGAGFVVTGTHTYNYASPGEPGASVVITDHLTGLTATASPTIVVAPVPLTITPKNFAVTPGTAFSGTVATFTDTNPLNSAGFYTATINWGDGTPTTTGTIIGSNPFTVSGSHTYQAAALANQGTAIVTITITDPNGQTATAVARAVDPPVASSDPTAPGPGASSAPAASTVSLTMLPGNLIVSPNGSFHGIVATFADGGPTEPAGAYKATIDWGKGRRSAGMVTGSNGRFVVSGKHAFPRFSGAKTVIVTVTDPEGQTVRVIERASEASRHGKLIELSGSRKGGAASRAWVSPSIARQ
jgi:hypothetical protein